MFKPKGDALQSCVIALTALSFMQIGYDNGLMGGLGITYHGAWLNQTLKPSISDNGFLQQDIQYPLSDRHIGDCRYLRRFDMTLSHSVSLAEALQSVPSLVPSPQPSLESSLVEESASSLVRRL